MDSCVTAAIANTENDELAFLHVSYGQRTEKRERQAFDALADHYGVDLRLVISLEHLAQIGGSSLTDLSIAVTAADLNSHTIPSSYVPFRNSHLLAAAVSWGEVINANAIYIGAVAEDSSGYPDCRPEFYAAFQNVIDLGTKPGTDIRIRTPVIHLKKSEIIRAGLELGAPLDLTWSRPRQWRRHKCNRVFINKPPTKLSRKATPIAHGRSLPTICRRISAKT
jgi:7-cyano-7-deazaguanine synthase